MSELDGFVTESNVDRYLSRFYACNDDPLERDKLLRLVVQEESRMGRRRMHLLNGERRLEECRSRVQAQRVRVAALVNASPDHPALLILSSYEEALAALEQTLRLLREQFLRAKL